MRIALVVVKSVRNVLWVLFIGGVVAACVAHMSGANRLGSASTHVGVKIVFAALVAAHVVVWPSAWSIFAAAAYAALVLGQVAKIWMDPSKESGAYYAAVANPGILLFQVFFGYLAACCWTAPLEQATDWSIALL